jgi:hypothetical protein
MRHLGNISIDGLIQAHPAKSSVPALTTVKK